MVDVINDDHWIPPLGPLLLLSQGGLLVLPEDVGESETVKFPDSGEDWHWELIANISKQVWQVGSQQDDSTGQVTVILQS